MKPLLTLMMLLPMCAVSEQPMKTCFPDGIGTVSKMFRYDRENVFAVGRWKWQSRPTLRVSPVNAVEIRCSKQRGVCIEAFANLTTLSEDESRRGSLVVLTDEYRVVSWSDSTIVALLETRAADVELRISQERKEVQQILTETEVRGATGASRGTQRLILQ